MKKEYTSPVVEEIMITSVGTLLIGSGVNTNRIGYGGVDTGGTMEPSSRELLDLLDI